MKKKIAILLVGFMAMGAAGCESSDKGSEDKIMELYLLTQLVAGAESNNGFALYSSGFKFTDTNQGSDCGYTVADNCVSIGGDLVVYKVVGGVLDKEPLKTGTVSVTVDGNTAVLQVSERGVHSSNFYNPVVVKNGGYASSLIGKEVVFNITDAENNIDVTLKTNIPERMADVKLNSLTITNDPLVTASGTNEFSWTYPSSNRPDTLIYLIGTYSKAIGGTFDLSDGKTSGIMGDTGEFEHGDNASVYTKSGSLMHLDAPFLPSAVNSNGDIQKNTNTLFIEALCPENAFSFNYVCSDPGDGYTEFTI